MHYHIHSVERISTYFSCHDGRRIGDVRELQRHEPWNETLIHVCCGMLIVTNEYLFYDQRKIISRYEFMGINFSFWLIRESETKSNKKKNLIYIYIKE